jgi:glutathione synthase/RimK-type ligase-like ATP-grasp enzyme
MVVVDVALASCLELPEPDADEQPLLDALRAAGLSAEVLPWDDPGAEDAFAAARVTVLRSTWNYSVQPDAFLAWIDRTATRAALWNGRDAVRWNAHKSYLLDLERRGVATVPTHLLKRGEQATLAEVMRARGWTAAVVKPAVSGGSRETIRVQGADGELAAGAAHLRRLLAVEDVLVQPYLESVEGYGERALVWIDGALTHAVRKSPRFLGDDESVSEAQPIAQDEARLAERAVDAAVAVAGPLLYARVDVARGPDGQPCVMELELIEPSLFFPRAPHALERYVAAVRARMRVD